MTALATEWQRVCALADVPDEGAIRVWLGDRPVCIARSGGDIFAVHDVCSHAEVALSDGEVTDGTVECWLHGSRFDLRTGRPTGLPATKPVLTYQTTITDGDVYVAREQKKR
jgi:3-phenylpropionate/trans-cinnamate dioxygenase ferredoxin component